MLMILSKLKLENFKKYTSYEIEFGEGLVGIIGKNGSGKSTIFEAILFALYGALQNKSYKEVIRNSQASTKDPVLVELSFEFESIEYVVAREFRGKALSANAKFYKNGELITTGAKEVTASITALTKMNKDAFLHTLFASQKELTSLSTQKPEERKKMIRKLLGLEKIDFIEKELIEKSRELKREISAFAEVLLSNEEVEVKNKHISQYKGQKDTLEKEVEVKGIELNTLKLKLIDIQKELVVLQETKEKKQSMFSNLELLKNTLNAHSANKDKLEHDLNTLELKQKELRGLESVKSQYTTLHESIKEQEKLKEHHIRKEGLQKEQVSLREQYKKSKDIQHTLEEQTKEHSSYIQKEKELNAQLSSIKEQLSTINEEEKQILQTIAGEQKLISDINKKIQNIHSLGRESNCPTCTRPLLDEYDNVLQSLEHIVKETQEQKILTAQSKHSLILKSKQTLEEQNTTYNKEYLELSKTINLCESKKRDLLAEQEHFKTVEKQGLRNKQELEQLASYTYDASNHTKLLEEQKELKAKYEYVLSLETMLKRLDTLKADLEKVKQNITSFETQYNDKEIQFKTVNYDEVKHKNTQELYTQTQKDKETKTNTLNDIKVQCASIEGQIKTISASLDNNNTQLAKVQTKKDDLMDYEKIKLSLGEFKTKLNAKIAPRISDIASDMYSIITKGKYQHIEVSNDFDFFIYDEGQKFPIERFSGGEIDLANLVLRIAISKTLSELSGASSVEFLAFDEVFGSQDESRRLEILEAFHTIKEQYRQIFLISHEMEIKEMFERVIEL